jgi:tRNA dimethylallyltransferase
MQKKKVIVILGQTATGKSDLAVKIARKIKGEIVSADSRQVYIGLDIGTGKITANEMQGIPHYLLDVANPKKKFTVVEYKKLADKKIKEIISRGKVPIICGGTGFYIDTITKGIIFPKVPPNEKLRKSLYQKSAIALFEYLNKIDSTRARDIKKKNEQNNKVRLIRAIEIVKYLGKVPKITEIKPLYKFTKIGLFLPTSILQKKVTKRVNKMFQQGLLKEIKKLKKKGVRDMRLKEFGFEYNQPTKEKVITGSIQYAKRQMTWFKRDPEIKWFDASKKTLFKEVLKNLTD